MSIQPSLAPDSETDLQTVAEVILMPGVEQIDEPAEDVHVHTIQCSPLWESHGRQSNWSGEIITDPVEIAAIRKRVEAGAEQPHRAIRRLFRRIRGGAA